MSDMWPDIEGRILAVHYSGLSDRMVLEKLNNLYTEKFKDLIAEHDRGVVCAIDRCGHRFDDQRDYDLHQEAVHYKLPTLAMINDTLEAILITVSRDEPLEEE
jgi:hypothetical protein